MFFISIIFIKKYSDHYITIYIRDECYAFDFMCNYETIQLFIYDKNMYTFVTYIK